MENKMTVSANYAMRHPSCLQSPQTAIPASNMHRASIPSASSKQPFSIEQAANILNRVSMRFIPHKKTGVDL